MKTLLLLAALLFALSACESVRLGLQASSVALQLIMLPGGTPGHP